MTEVDIRPAEPDDAEDVQRVARESWHAAYDAILGAETVESVVDEWYGIDALAESISRDDSRFLVAVTDAGTVGFAQAVLGDNEDDAAHLPRIYVHPDHWSEGVGSALVEDIESWVRERGAERLRLVVLADNEVGNAFYEKRGYRTVAARESEFEDETYEEYVREGEL